MEREQNGGNDISKHISMELMANGARVTNLKLEGGKLIMTVEADLSDSHFAADNPAVQSPAELPNPQADVKHVPVVPAPSSAGGIPPLSLGEAEAPAFEPTPAGGSETLRPRPESPVQPEAGSISLGFENEAVVPVPQLGAAEPGILLDPATPSQRVANQPPGIGLSIDEPAAPAPAPSLSLEPPAAPAPAPSLSLELPAAPAPAPSLSFEPAAPVAPAPAPVPPAAAGISIGTDTELGLKPFNPQPLTPALEPVLETGPELSPQGGGLGLSAPSLTGSEPNQTWDMSQQGIPPVTAPDTDPLTMPTVAFSTSPAAGGHSSAPGPALSIGGDSSWNVVPVPPLSLEPPAAQAPSTSESAREIKLGDDPFSLSPTAAPAPASAPVPSAPGPALSIGGEIKLGDDPSIGGINLSTGSEPPQPLMETWDPSSLSLDEPREAHDPLTFSEESSALGGPRHGEPQPSMSFGLGDPGALSLEPSPAPLSLGSPMPQAPASGAPSLSISTPPSLTPEPAAPALSLGAPAGSAPSLAFDAPAGPGLSLEPAAPALTPSLSLEPPAAPAPVPSLSLEPPAAPAPAPSLSLEPLAAPAPAPSLSLEPPPAPAPALSFDAPPAPPAAPAPAPLSLDAAAPVETPAPMPAPASAPQPPAGEKKSPEAGGTTVLIRYTCPKCKTQGMQAVDKVGTVVNCSNCGKAMRLVMKK